MEGMRREWIRRGREVGRKRDKYRLWLGLRRGV